MLHIAPCLVHYSRLYPEVTVELGLTNRMVDLLEEGWDVAVRIGQLNNWPCWRDAWIRRESSMCCTRVSLVQGIPRTVSDLALHNCLTYTPAANGISNPWLFQGPYGDIAVSVQATFKRATPGRCTQPHLRDRGF